MFKTMYDFRDTLDYKEMPLIGKALCWVVCPAIGAFNFIRGFIDGFTDARRYIILGGR